MQNRTLDNTCVLSSLGSLRMSPNLETSSTQLKTQLSEGLVFPQWGNISTALGEALAERGVFTLPQFEETSFARAVEIFLRLRNISTALAERGVIHQPPLGDGEKSAPP